MRQLARYLVLGIPPFLAFTSTLHADSGDAATDGGSRSVLPAPHSSPRGVAPDVSDGGLPMARRKLPPPKNLRGAVSTRRARKGNAPARICIRHRVGAPSVRRLKIESELSTDLVTRVIRQNFGRIRLCYEEGLRRNKWLRGAIGVRLTIFADGKFGEVRATGKGFADANVVSCALGVLERLQLLEPTGKRQIAHASWEFDPNNGPVFERCDGRL